MFRHQESLHQGTVETGTNTWTNIVNPAGRRHLEGGYNGHASRLATAGPIAHSLSVGSTAIRSARSVGMLISLIKTAPDERRWSLTVYRYPE